MRKGSIKPDITLRKRNTRAKITPGVLTPLPGRRNDINSVFLFSVQLYSLEHINVLLKTENILENILRNHLQLTLKETAL